MNRLANPEDELQLLRALCDECTSEIARNELLESFREHAFLDPEHQVVFESMCFLISRSGVSATRLAAHLNNRGFPDVDLEKYLPEADVRRAPKESSKERNHVTRLQPSQRGFSMRTAAIAVILAGLLVLFGFIFLPLRQFIRESFMPRVASAHYEILFPSYASPDTMRQFESQRETLFASLDARLGGAASKVKIRIVFEAPPSAEHAANAAPAFTVTGETIRTVLHGPTPQLDPVADAEAVLHAAWGDPGDARISQWTAYWLVGEWHGEELGMAAAAVEQKFGHQTLTNVLHASPNEIPSPLDQTLLGAAWVSEVADLDGTAAVQKVYVAKLPNFDPSNVARALQTTPLELDRQWQMWMYSYIAGMPAMPNSTAMPMEMPMH